MVAPGAGGFLADELLGALGKAVIATTLGGEVVYWNPSA
jgi:hypothetical protein